MTALAASRLTHSPSSARLVLCRNKKVGVHAKRGIGRPRSSSRRQRTGGHLHGAAGTHSLRPDCWRAALPLRRWTSGCKHACVVQRSCPQSSCWHSRHERPPSGSLPLPRRALVARDPSRAPSPCRTAVVVAVGRHSSCATCRWTRGELSRHSCAQAACWFVPRPDTASRHTLCSAGKARWRTSCASLGLCGTCTCH